MMTDETKQLIINAQSGDSKAFHRLVAMHDERIMVLAYQLMKNEQDAEDLYQESFVKAFKSLHTFRLESSFYTWLYRITVNTAINMKHKLARMRLQEPREDFDPLDIIAASSQDKDSGEITQAVKNAADTLPEKQRTVFILKYLQQMKIREIADIMDIGDGTVKKYLFRAMEKMRTELKEYRYV